MNLIHINFWCSFCKCQWCICIQVYNGQWKSSLPSLKLPHISCHCLPLIIILNHSCHHTCECPIIVKHVCEFPIISGVMLAKTVTNNSQKIRFAGTLCSAAGLSCLSCWTCPFRWMWNYDVVLYPINLWNTLDIVKPSFIVNESN